MKMLNGLLGVQLAFLIIFHHKVYMFVFYLFPIFSIGMSISKTAFLRIPLLHLEKTKQEMIKSLCVFSQAFVCFGYLCLDSLDGEL